MKKYVLHKASQQIIMILYVFTWDIEKPKCRPARARFFLDLIKVEVLFIQKQNAQQVLNF